MSEEEDWNELANILQRIEISRQAQDNNLLYAHRVLNRLQPLQRIPIEEAGAFIEDNGTETEYSNDSGDEGNTNGINSSGNQVRDRSKDLVRGYDYQLEEWVQVLNPKPGQPTEGEVIEKTKDDLYKIKGIIKVNEQNINKIIRRGHMNITVLRPKLY